MKKLLLVDVRRLLHAPRLYISFAIALAVLLRPLIDEIQFWHIKSPMQLLSGSLNASDYSGFAALFSVLPFADSFCVDHDSAFSYSIAVRCGCRKYALSRVITVALSGAIVIGGSILLTILICCACAGMPESSDSIAFMSETLWAYEGLLESPFAIYVLKTGLGIVFGMEWALLGLAVSTIVQNKYMTLILPFLVYQVLWILLSDLPINPVYLLKCDARIVPSIAFAFVYQVTIVCSLSMISCFGIERRTRV